MVKIIFVFIYKKERFIIKKNSLLIDNKYLLSQKELFFLMSYSEAEYLFKNVEV